MLPPRSHTVREVFLAFLRLGLTSFGGPIAHLGYFREEFVVRRGWLDDAHYAQLLAVCQTLPGPASSQMGFAIGLAGAGWRGALAAFAGFTLPSFLLMLAFAGFAQRLQQGVGVALLHGLKLVAVCVVAWGLWGMARQMITGVRRALLATAACVLVLAAGTAWSQLLAIAVGAVLGTWLCRDAIAPASYAPASQGFIVRHGKRAALAALAVFTAALALAILWPSREPTAPPMAAAFYRAGALVFGGGHVVLPLLQESLVDTGWIGTDTFLAGYGAAQAVPGPMFSIAAYLGAEVPLDIPRLAAALLAVAALFLPGFLLLVAALPAWQRLIASKRAAPMLAGINASVVGLLAAALYDPVLLQGVQHWSDVAIAIVGIALLARLRQGALWTVAWCVATAAAMHLLAR